MIYFFIKNCSKRCFILYHSSKDPKNMLFEAATVTSKKMFYAYHISYIYFNIT